MGLKRQDLIHLLVVLSLVTSWLTPHSLAESGTTRAVQAGLDSQVGGAAEQQLARYGFPKRTPGRPESSSYWADVDGDQDVDATDLEAVAGIWNCTLGQACYLSAYDRDANGVIDSFDLAAFGNEYDVAPPEITVTSPAEGALVSGPDLLVSGTVSDSHNVSFVTINGITATVGLGTFQATVPLGSGGQALHVRAADEIGQEGSLTRLVFADQEGPLLRVNAPADRQTVYTLRPTIAISYTDFYTGANTASLAVLLTQAGGPTTDVTGDLAVGPDGASGAVSFDLAEDAVYTLTVSLEDTLGNPGQVETSFYVPIGAGSITPPAVPANAGWVSGIVYDSSTCDTYLVVCQGIAGVEITLAAVKATPLQQARLARAELLAGHSGDVPMQASVVNTVTVPLSGTIVTGPDGFFAFPVDVTGEYVLLAEKNGFSYGQRVAQIVRGHSTPVNEIYVTPVDPAVTLCDSSGCIHTSADGQMTIDVPPGAILAGDVVTITATELDRVVFLPSGELPPGTQETYAARVEGDYQFTQPITVSVKNSRGFAPGTIIPLGSWNPDLFQWEHAGDSVVDPSGIWVASQLTHLTSAAPAADSDADFLRQTRSTRLIDMNSNVAGTAQVGSNDHTHDESETCSKCGAASEVVLRSGALRQEVNGPAVEVLGETVAPTFKYDSSRAAPSELIETSLSLESMTNAQPGSFVQVELYIEGQKTANFTFPNNSQLGEEIGHFRFLWDGRDAQGQRMPAGIYRYALRVRVPYVAEFYSPMQGLFGAAPDLTRPTGTFTNATADRWFFGSVTLEGDPPGSPFGAGWTLTGQQFLYEDEAGRILIDGGDNNLVEFFHPAKSLLPAGILAPAADSGLGGLYGGVEIRDEQLAGGSFQEVGPKALGPLAVEGDGTVETGEVVALEGENVAGETSQEAADRDAGGQATAEEDGNDTGTLTSGGTFQVQVTSFGTDVGGTIVTNTVWTLANSPYTITSDVTVSAGVTLTVEPGVLVMGQSTADLIVNGRLVAVGTLAQPITFTSILNSGPQQWGGLAFDGGTGHLSNTTVRYGGQTTVVQTANVAVRDVLTGEVRIESSRVLTADHVNLVSYGIYVENSNFVLSDTLVAGNGQHTLDIALYATGSNTSLTVSGNTFSNNSGTAVRVPAGQAHRLTGNSFAGNGSNRILLGSGNFAPGASLEKQNGLESFELEGSGTVPAGQTLFVQPGVTIMGRSTAALEVEGHLSAIGTPSQTITFTSEANTGPQQWLGLHFNGGTGEIRHATVRYGGQFYASNIRLEGTNNGPVIIANSRVLSSAHVNTVDFGVYVSARSVIITDTLIAGNGNISADYGLYVLAGGGATLTVTGSTFQNNTGAAVRVPPLLAGGLRKNSFAGNGLDRIVVSAGTFGAVTDLTGQSGLESYELEGGSQTVPVGGVLTVEPGLTIVGRSNAYLRVLGHLEAAGTPGQGITFTSKADTGAQQWGGILIDGGTGNLSHSIVRYAGQFNFANLRIKNVTAGQVRIESSQIVSAAHVNTQDYGLYIVDSRVLVSDTLIYGNGNASNDWALYSVGAGSLVTVTNSIFQNNKGGSLVRIPAASLRTFVGNQGLVNTSELTVFYGGLTLAQDLTMGADPGLSRFLSIGDVTVPAGITLTIRPGTTLGFFTTSKVAVQGRLDALGSSSAPIVFTSQVDSTPGQWPGIVVDGGRANLRFATIRYAKTALEVTDGHIDAVLSTFRLNQFYAVRLMGAPGQFRLSQSQVLTSGLQGVRNDTGVLVDARFNWWGHPTGPFHGTLNPAGQGDAVSDDVLFDPWQTDPNVDLILNLTEDDYTILTYDAVSGTYTRHYPDGTIVHFNADGTHDFTLDALGHKSAYTYNPDGTPATFEVTPAGEANPRWIWTFSYQSSAAGERSAAGAQQPASTVTLTDPAGRAMTMTMDHHGHLISIWRSGLTAPQSFAYDPEGRMTQKKDERGFVTSYVYDQHGRIQRTEGPPRPLFDPATGLTTMQQEIRDFTNSDTGYQLANNLSPGTPVTPTDALVMSDELFSMMRNGPVLDQGLTNQYGSTIQGSDALSRTVTVDRDSRDRIAGSVLPDGICSEFTYDEQGNRLSEVRMPAAQCALAPDQRDPAQIQQRTYTYEPRFNQLKSETDTLGRTTYYTYDYEVGLGSRGLLVEIAYPQAPDEFGVWVTPTMSLEYTSMGLLSRSVSLRGVATCLVYTQGTPDEAHDGANPLFAAGVTPVPGLVTQTIEDCGGPNQRTTVFKDFDAVGNPGTFLFPTTPANGPRIYRQQLDAANRVISTTDAMGVVTLYSYDNHDNLVRRVEDAGGRNVTVDFTYDPVDLLLRERISGGGQFIEVRRGYDLNRSPTMLQNGRGQVTRSFYDAAKQLVQVIDPAGNVASYAYDANSRIETMTNPRGMITLYEYDGLGRESRRTMDFGGLNLSASVEYDLASRPITLTDALGIKTCYGYDSLDRLASETTDCGGLNATTRHGYDLADNTIVVTNTLGHAVHMAYDSLDRLTRIVDALGHTNVYTYDTPGNRIASVDPLGRVTRFGYDLIDRLVQITNTLTQTTAFTYDFHGNLVAWSDKLGRTTTTDFDALDRPIRVTDPAGNLWRTAYDANGNVVAETDPLGRQVQVQYDALDRMAAMLDPAGGLTTYQYDGASNLIALTDQLSRTTTYSYDLLNRQTGVVDPLGNMQFLDYDAGSNLTSHVDALGQVTRNAYDSLYRLTTITDTNGAVTRLSYDLLDNLLSVTDPNGNVTSYGYDDINRRVSETDPLGATTAFTYDVASRLTAKIDRNGRISQYGYDALSRLTSESWVGDGRTINYSYDAMGQLTTAGDPDSAYTLGYDALGRNNSVDNAGTPGVPQVALNYGYDGSSNLRTVSEVIAGQGAALTAYGYDALNRMVSAVQSGSGVAPKRVAIDYDAASQLTSIRRYGDPMAAQPLAASSLTYDPAGRLTALSHTPAGGPPDNYSWSYNGNHRTTVMNLPDGSSGYGYDPFNQLVTATHTYQAAETYNYDPAGNRIGPGYVYSAANRLQSDGIYSYTYDAEGNRTQRLHIATGNVTDYAWDHRNRLANVLFKNAASIVTRTITYTYDVFDRRIGVTVDPDGAGPATATVERFVYDGPHIALTFDGSGALTHRYLYGPYIDTIIADEFVQGGEVYWPLADALGTVRDVLDNNGVVQNHLVYDSFGRITSQTTPSLNHRYAFTGREWDEQAGLYFYRNRYYDPGAGIFLSEDPLGFLSGDANLYRYVSNSPASLVDPYGLDDEEGWSCGNCGQATDGALTVCCQPEQPKVQCCEEHKQASHAPFSGEKPYLVTSLVPVYGSYREMRYHFAHGNNGWGLLYAGMMGADAASLGFFALVRTGAKGIWGFIVRQFTREVAPEAAERLAVGTVTGRVIQRAVSEGTEAVARGGAAGADECVEMVLVAERQVAGKTKLVELKAGTAPFEEVMDRAIVEASERAVLIRGPGNLTTLSKGVREVEKLDGFADVLVHHGFGVGGKRAGKFEIIEVLEGGPSTIYRLTGRQLALLLEKKGVQVVGNGRLGACGAGLRCGAGREFAEQAVARGIFGRGSRVLASEGVVRFGFEQPRFMGRVLHQTGFWREMLPRAFQRQAAARTASTADRVIVGYGVARAGVTVYEE